MLQFIHQIHSLFLSFLFLLVLLWHLTVSDVRVLFGRNLTFSDVTTVCSTGLSLISLDSLDDVDYVSEPIILSYSLLSEPEVDVFLRSRVSFSMPNKILLTIWAFIYICHFLWLLPLKHDSLMYRVQIKFMKFQRRHLVRDTIALIQYCCNLVPASQFFRKKMKNTPALSPIKNAASLIAI